MRKSLLSGMMLILLSANLFASGFQINENGARAMGMANAFTGLANDASAVFFNPAGMTQLKGTNFSDINTPEASYWGIKLPFVVYIASLNPDKLNRSKLKFELFVKLFKEYDEL